MKLIAFAACCILGFAGGILADAFPSPLGLDEEVVYAPYHCENGSWYAVSGDADSVTIACYSPDPDSEDSHAAHQ